MVDKPGGGFAPSLAVAAMLHRLSVLGGGVDWKRSALDANVLQGAIAARAAMARYRASRPEARERERRFAAASGSYAGALANGHAFAGQLRVVQVDGLTWSVPLTIPDDDVAVERYIKRQDFPYRVITQTRELGVGGVMLDIGANNGRMCVPRVVLGDAVAAYCAEPEPLNYACLVRNVRDNGLQGLIFPDRVAIGAENGPVRMVRAKSPGGHKVIDPGVRSKREVIDVPCSTLDAWCARLGLDSRDISFIKIDAQGSEAHVLRGAPALLAARHIAWQIEVDVALLAERGVSFADCLGLLRRHFTHWIDLNRLARGVRVRAIDQLADGLSYLRPGQQVRTDLLAFNLDFAFTSEQS